MKTPKYLQLYHDLREEIVSGVWPQGTKAPSKRAAAERAGVSLVTAEQAYALLCEEGYLEARQRSGYFVMYRRDGGYFSPADDPLPRAVPAAPTQQGEAFPFSVLARQTRRVLQEQGEALLARAPGEGVPALRQAIARYLARSRGLSVAPRQVLIGSGAEYLYGLIVKILGRDRKYAAEDPSYEKIAQVYQAEGADCELLPLGPDGLISSALWKSGAQVLHVTPYHSFPSGVTADASKRLEYVRWAERPGRYLVEDDFDSEFRLSGRPQETLFALAGGKGVLYLNTFSRTIAPSLRAGYLVLPEDLLPLYGERAGFYSCPVPVMEQYVLAGLLDSGELERHINRVRRKKRAENTAQAAPPP